MPQISLYVDKDTLQKVEKAAKMEHLSISKWVVQRIRNAVSEEYPDGYFDLFGKIQDDSFGIDSLDFDNDSKREGF